MGLVYSNLIKSMPRPTKSYAGKTVIVTGSNVGLGKEAARHYARLGAGRLILAVRNKEKGYAAKEDILASVPGYPGASIEIWELDMARYASVQAFAARVCGPELDRVDVFLANAGIFAAKFQRAEADESTITVNVVSTFLLALLVLPKLKQTAARFPGGDTRPVFTVVTSLLHGYAKFPQRTAPQIFDALNQDPENFDRLDRYNISKLLELLVIRAIAERYPADKFPVTFNCLNPGLCKSELTRDLDSFAFALLIAVLGRSTEEGSRTLVHAAAQGPESHGKYLDDCAITNPSKFVRSAEGKKVQDKVWEELMAKLETIQPGITGNL